MANNDFTASIEFRPFDMDASADIERLGEWSTASDDMLPLSIESIARHHLSTGAYIFGELAGYGAISVIYSRDVIEFGGLVVNPELRRHHVGSAIVKKVVETAHSEMDLSLILAMGNDNSGRLFKRLGGYQVENGKLPPEVWKLCHICPRLEIAQAAGKQCCDRAFDITNISTEI
jgi:N-acetylglutamate synthase-like GNAT family acetyltransferase